MSEVVTITDPSTGSRARVAVDIGFNCFEFRAAVGDRQVDVIDARPDFPRTGERPSGNGFPLLFPFPNRIAQGRFTWDGREYLLPARPGMSHAIHGFALDRPWRITAQRESSVTAEFQISRDAPDRTHLWPADGSIEVTYRVHRSTLRVDVRITNPDDQPLPFGFGAHTYFKLPLGPQSEPGRCLIHAAARRQWLLEESIPSGAVVPIAAECDLRDGRRYGELKLDHVLTDLEYSGDQFECGIMDDAAGLEVVQQFDRQFRELVAFTPAWTTAVCLEPYTCTTDAINLAVRGIDSGWRVLPPGGEFRTWIQITARPILV